LKPEGTESSESQNRNDQNDQHDHTAQFAFAILNITESDQHGFDPHRLAQRPLPSVRLVADLASTPIEPRAGVCAAVLVPVIVEGHGILGGFFGSAGS
jgi:hypothetical protein